jgi:large subunit ribosomal protein L6
MSRIGKQPIELPAGVSVSIAPGRVMVNGPLGELTQQVPVRMQVDQEDSTIVVKRPTERGDDRALHGLTRSLIANMVEGVTSGFQKRLEIQGVGYRAALRGTDLELNVGFSHPVVLKAPQGITFEVPTPTEVLVKGIDKQQVGEIAAQVRKVRPPEPYKGKGIRYEGEYVAGRSGSAHERVDRPEGARAPAQARAGQDRRHRRAAAAGRVPLEPRDRGAAGGRPRGQDPRRRELAAPEEVVQGIEERAGGRGRQTAGCQREEGEGRDGRLRPRRLPLPRSRKALADAAREGGLKF